MKTAFRLMPAAALILALSMSACGDDADPYSKVVAPCSYFTESGFEIIEEGDAPGPEIKKECLDALEPLLPFDESWKDAPKSLKNIVIEAFRAIVAYPLRLPPRNQYFGVSPYAIPSFHLELLRGEQNYNQSLFNHVLSAFQSIHYKAGDASTPNAHYWHEVNLDGKLTIFKDFQWNLTNGVTYKGGFLRASTLVHEAQHGNGFFHVSCNDESGFQCDSDLKGPYGLATTYLEMVLHGGGHKGPDGKAPILSDGDVHWIGLYACLNLKRIHNLPGELNALISGVDCGKLDYETIRKYEGLDR